MRSLGEFVEHGRVALHAIGTGPEHPVLALDRMQLTGPVALAVDDLQWIDPASADALAAQLSALMRSTASANRVHAPRSSFTADVPGHVCMPHAGQTSSNNKMCDAGDGDLMPLTEDVTPWELPARRTRAPK